MANTDEQPAAAHELADRLNAIVAARGLLNLATDLDGNCDDAPSELLADFGLTRPRVWALLAAELRGAELAIGSCRAAELAALARDHGCVDGRHLAQWLRGIADDFADEPPADPVRVQGTAAELALACRMERLRIGVVLAYLLAGFRSVPWVPQDAFADRGLHRERMINGLRFDIARASGCGGDRAELAELDAMLTRARETRPTPTAAELAADRAAAHALASELDALPRRLYVVSQTDEHTNTNEPAANEPPASGPETVAQVVARLRRARGFSRRELGRLAGLSLSTVRGIELGKRDAKLQSCKSLAAAFGLSFVQFATMIGGDS